ncbi:MAG: hypothetical protein IPK17_34750 [Chloroflexi bacterium]|uniref:hypothetical protein n=1 Tax=Candidatus Flexifilum breve TaxID=3140694 RepID=UPI0031363700|nr:hypothetical protein [Chloroflexota bacterium]
MGGINKAQFSLIKSLLRLSDEALELADRHSVEEGKLRHVVPVAPEYHGRLFVRIIDFNLSSKQVKELCEGDMTSDDEVDPLEKLPPSAVKMAKITQTISATTPQDLARALIRQEGDPGIAKARLQALKRLLIEAEHYFEAE